MRTLALLIVILLLAGVSPAFAVVHVKHDSPGPVFNGDSWETAYHNIQAGVNEATSGEEVLVARGDYQEKVVLKAGVTLKGGYAGIGDTRDVATYITAIDAGDASTNSNTVTSANQAAIDGFTITGGYTGVFCASNSPIISNNLIKGNTVAGVWLTSSSASVTDNIIEENGPHGIICWF
ncbi:MAG: DUF1565 domain-containing protein, partial [Armatimonadota bacterium]|nr:DUF1565 domain-containing protein [Armatimonadota bacterium]